LINTFTGHTNWVNSIDYSTFDDCQFICSGSDNKTIRVWDVDNNKQIQSFNGHSFRVNCVKFSPYHYHNHRQHVICSSSFARTIRFWDFKHNKQLQIFNGHTNSVYGIEFHSNSPDLNQIENLWWILKTKVFKNGPFGSKEKLQKQFKLKLKKKTKKHAQT
ncbi:WD-40 repeat protein, partial [Reticulomyxa filosa]